MSLPSIALFLSQLSQRTISGSLLKYLSKLQVDEEPAIRTNTTILLGNIVLKKDMDVYQLQWYGYCLFKALACLHKQIFPASRLDIPSAWQLPQKLEGTHNG
ncbi:hypothetical protein SO802_012018 [Lithocarpus litseifolius]|uniref:Uncharacterized protein n=1 Tax=Lithocarpus litseifolius TaxID=425828 RepID=A0AAW2D3R0_9ROSI